MLQVRFVPAALYMYYTKGPACDVLKTSITLILGFMEQLGSAPSLEPLLQLLTIWIHSMIGSLVGPVPFIYSWKILVLSQNDNINHHRLAMTCYQLQSFFF